LCHQRHRRVHRRHRHHHHRHRHYYKRLLCVLFPWSCVVARRACPACVASFQTNRFVCLLVVWLCRLFSSVYIILCSPLLLLLLLPLLSGSMH
jgi:hypothetical protein